jgi:hypothetical protein
MSTNSIRQILHSAYSFIRSVESNKAIASLTLDHLIQEQIDSLKKGETRSIVDGKGESVGNRVSRWDRLDALEKDIENAVKAIKDAGGDVDKLKAIGIYEADQDIPDKAKVLLSE